MYTEALSKAVLFIFANIGCASCLFGPPALRAESPAIPQRPTQGLTLLRPSRASVGAPVRLRIPSIGVDAAIEPVGRTSKGMMDAPGNPDTVGWYSLGSRPGEKGSAVLAGHLDWYGGKTAGFRHLDALRKGGILSVETDKGKFVPFVVREMRTLPSNEYAPDLFRSSDGSHLNLVTCSGAWDTARKNYSERLVVSADAAGPGL